MTSPFGATTTAAEVLRGVDLTGRRMVVTGASSGIGVETARALARAGAEVTLAVRDVEAGRRVAAGLPDGVRVEDLDLASLPSIDAFVSRWTGPLHALVNNAGVMALPDLRRTAEGWEMQLAVNYLGHFALTLGLLPAFADRARIVSVSSVGHVNGGVDLDDLNFETRPYDPWVAYSQSKTADILFAVEAARRWPDLAVNALNPGRIWETGLGRHGTNAPTPFNASGVSVKNVEQGAATSVLLAASPTVEGITGRYFEDCRIAEPYNPPVRRGIAPHATDPRIAARLWDIAVTVASRPRRPEVRRPS